MVKRSFNVLICGGRSFLVGYFECFFFPFRMFKTFEMYIGFVI